MTKFQLSWLSVKFQAVYEAFEVLAFLEVNVIKHVGKISKVISNGKHQ